MSSNTTGIIGAFVGGALLGFAGAILFAPMKGAELREKIQKKLREHSIILSDLEVEELIARLEADDEAIV